MRSVFGKSFGQFFTETIPGVFQRGLDAAVRRDTDTGRRVHYG